MKQKFVQIQNGNAKVWALPHNIEKIEKALAKVKAPKWGQTFTKSRDFTRVFPQYKSGMSTAEYVNQYEKANRMGVPTNSNIRHGHGITGLYSGLNENPAAEYDAAIPLCVEDQNPDYDPAEMPAPKAKAPRISKQAARIAELEDLLLQALPFIEDLTEDACYKPGIVLAFRAKIRAALDLK